MCVVLTKYEPCVKFMGCTRHLQTCHDDVIKWKHFLRNWLFVRGIHRSPVNSPHKEQWRGTLMFSFICVWINDWVNSRDAGDLRRYRTHYDVILMCKTLNSAVLFNTLRPRQNCRHSPDDILNPFSWINIYEFRIKRSFLRVQLTIIQRLVGAKPLFEPMMA